ncbi:SECY [Symbiodinium sp. KB8]|nr:SECY [Symbiodinium sp. KB8]
MRAARGAVIALLAGLTALSANAFLPPAGTPPRPVEPRLSLRGASRSAAAAPGGTPAVLGVAALLAGASARLCRDGPTAAAEPRILRRAEVKSDVNYLSLLTKGDLPKRIAIVILLLALARIGFYIPLYGFDVDATEEYFSRQQTTGGLGFVDQLFGGGLGRVSLFSLGIGPYITASIVIQILTTITPSLKALAAGEEGEAGREKYKNYTKIAAFLFALVQGFGQSTLLAPFVFDNGPVWAAQITLQFAVGSMTTLFIADQITEQKLGNGASLLVFSSIVANLPRTLASTAAKASDQETGQIAVAVFSATLLVTILGLVYVLQAERRIPILFAKRLQEEASGQGATDDAGQSYLPIKLNASGVLPLIFAGRVLQKAIWRTLADKFPSVPLEEALPGMRINGTRSIKFNQYYFDDLYLALHSPGQVDIVLHDGVAGIAESGKSTIHRGNSVNILGACGKHTAREACREILQKLLSPPHGCKHIATMRTDSGRIAELVSQEQLNESYQLSATCYKGIPLAGHSPCSRALRLQDVALAVDQKLHMQSRFRRDVGASEVVGMLCRQRRGMHRSSADWWRDNVRVEFKSSKMSWVSGRRHWHAHFSAVKFASQGHPHSAVFDELILGLYTPFGLYMLRYSGDIGCKLLAILKW